jgi:PAS domain S-box-containing protein
MFGCTVAELVDPLGPLELVYPDDRPIVAENIRRRVAGEGEEARYEFRGLRKDGSVFPVEVHGRRIEHNGTIGVLGTLVDDTDRKRAEAELRASEERFRALVQFSFDVYWESDAQHRFTRQEFAEGYSNPSSPPKSPGWVWASASPSPT